MDIDFQLEFIYTNENYIEFDDEESSYDGNASELGDGVSPIVLS